jgi:2-phosphoglycerate kinase
MHNYICHNSLGDAKSVVMELRNLLKSMKQDTSLCQELRVEGIVEERTRGRKNVILILGPPGVGKGAHASLLAKELGVPHFLIGTST